MTVPLHASLFLALSNGGTPILLSLALSGDIPGDHISWSPDRSVHRFGIRDSRPVPATKQRALVELAYLFHDHHNPPTVYNLHAVVGGLDEQSQQLWRSASQKRTLCAAAKCAYSITSSAMLSSPDEGLRPSALAVLRLITSSNLVGCWIGRSAGLAPLRMRSMYPAAWRNSSARSSA